MQTGYINNNLLPAHDQLLKSNLNRYLLTGFGWLGTIARCSQKILYMTTKPSGVLLPYAMWTSACSTGEIDLLNLMAYEADPMDSQTVYVWPSGFAMRMLFLSWLRIFSRIPGLICSQYLTGLWKSMRRIT